TYPINTRNIGKRPKKTKGPGSSPASGSTPPPQAAPLVAPNPPVPDDLTSDRPTPEVNGPATAKAYPALVAGPAPGPSAGGGLTNLPIGNLAAPDCVLWLWSDNRRLPEALRAVVGWGFRYLGLVTWMKTAPSPGEPLKEQTAHCVVAVRGQPALG